MTGVKSFCKDVMGDLDPDYDAWTGTCLALRVPVSRRKNVRTSDSKMAAAQIVSACWKFSSVSVFPPERCIRAKPNTGARKALRLKTKKFIAPVALPLTLSGLASLIIV